MWAILFVCGGVALVQGATLKDNHRAASAVDSVSVLQRRSVSTTYQPYFDLNHIADNIIQLAIQDIVQQGKTRISLPDVWEEKKVRVSFFTVPYELRVKKGTVGDLDTFRRTGDVLSTKYSKETLRADVPLALDRVTVRYGYYNLKVIGLDITGDLKWTMDAVSFVLTIYGEETDLGCTASLVKIEVTNIGKIGVNVTGFGYPLDGVVSSIVATFLDERMLGIVNAIEKVLLKELPVVLQDYHCDELQSLFLLPA